ncbi:MAG: CPBP family glutamic-type intramembrane protease, partial [Planctomycetota bacterium]
MRRGATRAVAALAAALALTLAVFLLYRGLQRFAGFAAAEQRVGVYFTSGLVFATVGWLGLPGRRLDSLRRRAGALEDLGLGLVASTAIGALALLLGMQVVGPARDPGAALVPLGTAVLAVALWNLPTGRVRRWTSRPLLWVAAALPFLTLLRAVDGGRELSEVAVRLVWLIGVVGFGEELFFRGFLQGRLDRSLGTPWRLPGVQFGPG